MLEQLQRRSALDPQNQTLQLNVVAAMAREGRSLELVAPLMDREAWNKAGEYAQGLAAIEVGRRLGEGWELSGLRVWSCENKKVCQACEGSGLKKGWSRDRDWYLNESRFCPSCRDVFGQPLITDISHRLATFIHSATGIEFQLLPGRPGLGYELKADPDHPGCNTADVFGPEDERYGEVGGSVFYGIEPFLIARWPVTYGQTIGSGKESDNLPVTGFDFNTAEIILSALGFYFPTPAQWEYACKAGSETRFYFGDEFDPSHVWFAGNSGEPSCGTCIAEPSINHPHPPKIISHAEHEAAGKWNAFGLVDMIGNVFEWVDPGHTYSSSYLYSRQLTEANFLYPNAQNSESLHDVGFRPIKTIDWSE